MATGFTLWFALLGLYLIESLRLTAVRSLIFVPRLFRDGSNGRAPNTYPGNGRWAWTLLPVWPVRPVVLVSSPPLVAWGLEHFSPNVTFVQSTLAAIQYEDVKTVSADEKTLRVNGSKFMRFESEAEAQAARVLLERLRATAAGKRESVIRECVSQAFTEKIMVQRLARIKQATRYVRVLSNALWWILVVVFPLTLLLLRVPDAFVILGVGAVALLLAVAVAVSFAKAGAQLHPDQKAKYRWKSVKFVVYPVGAMRAVDELTLDSQAGIHPVVLATVLGKGARQLADVKRSWQQACSPLPMSVDADAKALACSLWFNGLVRAEMKSYLTKALPAALVEERVQPHDKGCLSYCPNCKTQYVAATGTCADCRGVPLRAFALQQRDDSNAA